MNVVSRKDWRATPRVIGRLATEDDVRNGRAAFYLANTDNSRARPTDTELPRLALYTDEEAGTTETVIVIQAEDCWSESAPDALEVNCIIGYRSACGTFGVCSRDEIVWIDAPPGIHIAAMPTGHSKDGRALESRPLPERLADYGSAVSLQTRKYTRCGRGSTRRKR